MGVGHYLIDYLLGDFATDVAVCDTSQNLRKNHHNYIKEQHYENRCYVGSLLVNHSLEENHEERSLSFADAKVKVDAHHQQIEVTRVVLEVAGEEVT